MNALDWLIVLIVLGSAFVAAAQGFFFEVISLAGAVAGYLAAAWGYGRTAPWFLPYVKSQAFANLAGFITIFLAVVLLGGAIARIVRWMVREVGLRWVDRVLGAAFGLLRGLVVVTAGLLAITAFAPELQQLKESHLANYFVLAAGGASWLAPAEIRQKYREGMDKLRGDTGPAIHKRM